MKYNFIIIAFCAFFLIFFIEDVQCSLLNPGFIENTWNLDTTSSLAFKKNRPESRTNLFYQPDLSYQLWKQFNLIREANSGDALAQHELGIRYLLGDGVPADTILGAYWIHKAVENKLPAAEYNYGILLMNGWGVNWNPFDAYDYFIKAADKDMPQAEYIVGIFYTDNLVVERDWSTAYKWVKKASDSGFEPAKKILKELKEKIPPNLLDSTESKTSSKKDKNDYSEDNSLASTLGLSFIDFETIGDTVKEVSNKMLQKDLLLTGNKKILDTLTEYDNVLPKIDTTDIPLLMESAESGCPEALNFIGRFYEKGIYYPQNSITALAYYIRALRLDSPRSPWLIWNLTKKQDISTELQKQINERDPVAMFVLYGLYTFGYYNQIVQEDAVRLLKESAEKRYIPALNELGIAYSNGNILKADHKKAEEIWKEAENLGSKEAKIQLAAAEVFNFMQSTNLNSAVETLLTGADTGSILSQVALAYCYEKGIDLNQDKAKAVKNYRLAAQRGNRFAYNELKRMYDEIRPDEKEFKIN